MEVTEKPLHVQVAEALGWTDCEGRETERWESRVILNPSPNRGESVLWIGRQPLDPTETPSHPMIPMRTGPHSGRMPIPRYDTDWSAAGPLIEKYDISLTKLLGDPDWRAEYGVELDPGFCDEPGGRDSEHAFDGPTPLLAVCGLILALKEADKL